MHGPPPIRASLSLINDLLVCRLRAICRLDPELAWARRPSVASALGLVSHELWERVAKGEFDSVPAEEVDQALQLAWAEAVSRQSKALRAAWPDAEPPTPDSWPGYQLTRVRLLQPLRQEVVRRSAQKGAAPVFAQGTVETEVWLEDRETGLVGRADRVEVDEHGDVHIVDLKSGWTQALEVTPPQRRQLLLYAYLWHRDRGVWPKRASIQVADGRRMTLTVDIPEAQEVAAEALQALEELRVARESAASNDELASPGAESCRHCSYRAACQPFLSALNEDWNWYRRSVVGTAGAAEAMGNSRVVLHLQVERGNLPSEIHGARLIGLPEALCPSAGDRIVVIDAIPRKNAADLQVSWDTEVLAMPPNLGDLAGNP